MIYPYTLLIKVLLGYFVKNQHGLDIGYINIGFQQIQRDLADMTPDAFADHCARMVREATPAAFRVSIDANAPLFNASAIIPPPESFSAKMEDQWQVTIDELAITEHELREKDAIIESVREIVDSFKEGSLPNSRLTTAFNDIYRVLCAGSESIKGRYILKSLLVSPGNESMLLKDLIQQESVLFDAQEHIKIIRNTKGDNSSDVKFRWEGWLAKCGDIARQQQESGVFTYDGDLHKKLFLALPNIPEKATFPDMVRLLVSYIGMLQSSMSGEQISHADRDYADRAIPLLKLAKAEAEIENLKARLSNRAADQINQLEELLVLQEALHVATKAHETDHGETVFGGVHAASAPHPRITDGKPAGMNQNASHIVESDVDQTDHGETVFGGVHAASAPHPRITDGKPSGMNQSVPSEII